MVNIDGKPLSALSDAELQAELRRRRRARRAPEPERPPSVRSASERLTRNAASWARSFFSRRDDEPKTLAQCYEALELSPEASLDEVRTAYRRLMRKYDPDKHLADPEKHRAAEQVSRQLTRAYRQILDDLER